MFKKIFFLPLSLFILIISLTSAPAVLAAETAIAGITPSNPLYFLDTLAEKISLALTFNPISKVTKAKGYAVEKSAELACMLQKNNERGEIRAARHYQEMVEIVIKKMDEAAAKNSEFKNAFIPQMITVINGYNGVLRTQNYEKTKELNKIAEKKNNLFIQTYEAPRQSFISFDLTPQARKKKLCEIASTRPVKDDITKVLNALCEQKFVEILATDKQKQDTVYKIIFDAANRNDISDTTKAIVQQIALTDLPVSQTGSSAALAVKTAPSEFKNIKSRQITCNFSCNSNNCPAHQGAEAKRKDCLNPIYYPIDSNNSSEETAEQEALRHVGEECRLRGEGQRQCQTGKCDTVVLLSPDGKERTVKSCCCSCANENFDNKSRRVFDPWDWGGESLIDRLLSPAEIEDAPRPPLVSEQQTPSFTVSQDSCAGSKDAPWHGSGTIVLDKIALSDDNEETFMDNLQSAFQEARRNCPGAGYDSYSLTMMCSVYDFVTGERYSDQYGESGGKCPTSEAGQLEKTDVHTETWTYMASQDKEIKNIAENIKEVEMVITLQGRGKTITLPVEFDALTKEIKVNGANNTLPAGDYNYKIKFVLKDDRTVSPEDNNGYFTIRPCHPLDSLDCSKLSTKVIFDEPYADGCSYASADNDYTEQILDTQIAITNRNIHRYPSSEEAKKAVQQEIEEWAAMGFAGEREPQPLRDVTVGDYGKLIVHRSDYHLTTATKPASVINYEQGWIYNYHDSIKIQTGRCVIWIEGSAITETLNNPYHQLNDCGIGCEELPVVVNKHPDFDHGKQRLEDILIEFAQEVSNNIGGQCGG